MELIKSRTIIIGPQWPEPVEIKLIEQLDSDVHIVGATTVSKGHIDQVIPLEEFQKISILQADALFKEEPAKVFLALETMRYRFVAWKKTGADQDYHFILQSSTQKNEFKFSLEHQFRRRKYGLKGKMTCPGSNRIHPPR